MRAIAETLLGQRIDALVAIKGGGNNRVFCVHSGTRRFALKFYPPQTRDQRDRLGREWQALCFLRGHGIDAVPRPLARDDAAHAALYEWVEGGAPTDRKAAIAAMADLFGRIQQLRPLGRHLAAGSDPVLCPAQALAQFHQRLAALTDVPAEIARHLSFLQRAADHVTARAKTRLGDAFDRPVEPDAQVLSPSDFGLHNMLMDTDGRVRFLDFEYFGWDGPDKALADMRLHPGSGFSASESADLTQKLAPSPELHHSLPVTEPLFGLIWCLILLNEFRSDRRERRGLADGSAETLAAQKRQFDKSRLLFERLSHDYDLAHA